MFSTTSAHALRALAHLAPVPDGIYVLGRDLAVTANIPANYLSKILLALRNAGLIVTVRGSGGGYRLSKPPHEISMIEVVELFESNPLASPCLLDGGRSCSDDKPCTAHNHWCPVRDAYAGFLDSTTIEDISRRREGTASGRSRRGTAPRAMQRGGARL